MTRRTALAAVAALFASRTTSRAQDMPYFPAGCRLGFLKPATLSAVPTDRNLLAQHLHVVVTEPVVTGGPRDHTLWRRADYEDARLLHEKRVSAREERRFFERDTFVGNPDIGWQTLVVRETGETGETNWFGQLDFRTSGADGRARAKEMIDAILASVTVRPALSVGEMLAEHGIAMDLTGLHPHHFGNRLTISLREPRTLAERWTNDAHIAMPNPPAVYLSRLEDPTSARRKREEAIDYARKLFATRAAPGPVSEWTSNGIVWLSEPMRPLIGTTLSQGFEGYGATRVASLNCFCKEEDREEMNAVSERVARSVRLDP